MAIDEKQIRPAVQMFEPTKGLRWLTWTREMCDGPGNDIVYRKLQQAWRGTNGEIKWVDIPEIETSREEFRKVYY